MLAQVFVAATPYRALIGEDGSFRITDIPGENNPTENQWAFVREPLEATVRGR